MSPEHGPEAGEARPGQAMVQAVEALSQLPFTVFTAWWNLMASPCMTLTGPPHHPHRDQHEQLIVPDPLEEASERALFA